MVVRVLQALSWPGRHRPPLFGAGAVLVVAAALLSAVSCLGTPAGAVPGLVFASDWSKATGTSRTAVTDGGRWKNFWEWGADPNVHLLEVVPGGPGGRNVLKVVQRGSTFAANLQQDHVVPRSTDFYVRYYMRNDDTSAAGDHIVTANIRQYANLTFMRKSSASDGWQFFISLYGCGFIYPIGHWSPSVTLSRGVWYRFEYHVLFVDATHVQVHARVYDAAGTQILGDADFRQSDWGGASWNGRSDWTFASYYAAGHTFCVDPVALTSFGMGNNGQQGAVDTGLPWYYADVQIRTDWWPGP